MDRETKMVNDDWLRKITDCEVDPHDVFMELFEIDGMMQDLEQELDNTEFGGIGYVSQSSAIHEMHDKMNALYEFVMRLPEKMEELDRKFCETLQNGSVHQLSEIKAEDLETRKVGNLTGSYMDHGNEYKSVASSLRFEDFLGVTGNGNEYSEDYAPAD